MRKNPQHGFTLIEVMLVIVVVGILTGLVVANLSGGGGRRELATEAARLASCLELGAEEAVASGEEYGLDFDKQQYRFLRFDERERRWRETDKADICRPHTLPDDLQLRLVDAPPVPPRLPGTRVANSKDADQAPLEPEILLLSSGDLQPAVFELSRAGREGGEQVRLSAVGLATVGDEASETKERDRAG